MNRSVLDIAQKLLRKHKFAKAITLLEGRSDVYEDNFDYYLTLGIACLYVGDAGSAASYFQKARTIKLTDTRLLLGQAAIYLRRGDTDRAVRYYLDIQDNDPNNKTAAVAMDFIRTKGDYGTICRWVDSGKIKKFYPPLGSNPAVVQGTFFFFCTAVLACILILRSVQGRKNISSGLRADLASVTLNIDEKKHAQQTDLSGSVYRYLLTASQITASYDKALAYFQEYRDNAAQVELNRIAGSNAAFAIRQKARLFMSYLKEPTFDTLIDNYTYKEVSSDIPLYLDCYVSWTGRISNVDTTENSFRCDLLVGYEEMQRVEGVVPLRFTVAPAPPIDGEKPVRILAKVNMEDGKLILDGKAVYQSVNGSLEVRK